jgi:MoaA/NifB/PqqE/SkfB family radical SAM enzyme
MTSVKQHVEAPPSSSNESATSNESLPALDFFWAELTGKCNLECTHCYAGSSPKGTHGQLSESDWKRVIRDAANVGAKSVCFIGGEPTLHPSFEVLVRFSAEVGIAAEVYSNLLFIPDDLWPLFSACNVTLATSFYSQVADAHDRITTRHGSQVRTLANIRRAIAEAVPLRVGVIAVNDDQDIRGTEAMLRAEGVKDIGLDRVRGVGRGVAYEQPKEATDALCGQCWTGKAAVDPNGWVYPCVFSRWLPIGNVRSEGLGALVAGEYMAQVRNQLFDAFNRPNPGPCFPQTCMPQACLPRCSPNTGPCKPMCRPTACNPAL